MPRRILIIDDNPVDRFALRSFLDKDYLIEEAEGGQAAFSRLVMNPHGYAAIVVDGMMPDMDGYAFSKKVRANGFMAQIPIIIATSDTDEETLTKALTCGANNYITKPYNAEMLLAMVKNCVHLRETAALVNELQRDKLTGIYNRDAFLKETARLIRHRPAGYFILSSFDIDRFKVINDQYGMETGDRVLKHIAAVFKEGFERLNGICCRVSEDKFAVLYPLEYRDSDAIEEIRANAAHIEGLPAALSFSVGRYIISDLSLPIGAMYDRAMIAAESIKGRYGERIAYYDEPMRAQLLYEQAIVNDMERALREGEFEPWFQPQYNHSTGAMIGSEALIRWRKNGKIVSPNDFIDVLEKNGFIYQVDQYVWRQVCAFLRHWLDTGRQPLPVSVNVSRYDVFQKDCASVIYELVNEYNLPIELLRIEVTESAFSESPEQIAAVVAQLAAYGFTVEIDDFGSGYSSLNTLKDVPAQILKLDMRFLESGNSQRGGSIIESIVRMAKWLGMSVIAEGVETLAQADYLCSVGCNYMQGYLYARPMPAAQFEAFFNSFDKEKQLIKLETVENLDSSSFWNPDSMDTLIFNSYVGAACIFEYHDGRAELIRINKKYQETLCPGASMEDIFKRDIQKGMDAENRRILTESIERAIATNDESACETIEKGFGSDAPIYIRSTVRVIARSGEHYLLYATIINMTARRTAEIKERQLLTQMQNMMADMPGGFVRIRAEPGERYVGVFCNAGFCKLLGMDFDTIMQLYSEAPLANVHPEDAPIVRKAVKEMLENGEAQSSRYRLSRSDGSYICVTVFGRVTRDQDGNTFLNLYYTDVTERENEERQQQMLLDNLPCGAGVYAFKDGEMRLVYQNRSYWELVGLNQAAFPDPAPMSAIHPDDIPRIMEKLSAAIADQQDVVCDIRLRHLALGYCGVRLVARIVQEETGGFLIVAIFIPNGKLIATSIG